MFRLLNGVQKSILDQKVAIFLEETLLVYLDFGPIQGNLKSCQKYGSLNVKSPHSKNVGI